MLINEYAEKNYKKPRQTFITCQLSFSTNPGCRSYKPIAVRSTYTVTAVFMLCENCEFGDYLPTAGAYVKDSGTSDSSKNYHRMEPQTILLKFLTLTNDITTRP